MIKLYDLIPESIRKTFEKPPLIIVEMDGDKISKCIPDLLLKESQWKKSNYRNYFYRIDPPNPDIPTKKHVAIAHRKHLKAKNKQVSWTIDGARHDKHSFDSNFHGLKKAERIARDVLNLDKDIKLEHTSVSILQKAYIKLL